LKTIKRFALLLTAVALLVTIPLFAPVPHAQAAAAPKFTDLKKGQNGYDEVVSLVSQQIIQGYGDGSFKPYANISRAQVAVMLTKAFKLPVPANVDKVLAPYSDVKKDHMYAKEIAAVTAANVFKGGTGKFNPNKPITRQQMATVLVKAFDLKASGKTPQFADAKQLDAIHRNNVNILAQNGISAGRAGKNGQLYFDGNVSLKRVQFAVFLDRAMKLQDKAAIQSVSHVSSAGFTNFKVSVRPDVHKVKVDATDLQMSGVDLYTGAFYGLKNGVTVTIRAYSETGKVLETKSYVVTE